MTKRKPKPKADVAKPKAGSRVKKIKAKVFEPIDVNFHAKVTLPIRDMFEDGQVVFLVDVYGVVISDITVITDDIDYINPFLKAVKRLGLDPHRYQAILWDLLEVTPDGTWTGTQ